MKFKASYFQEIIMDDNTASGLPLNSNLKSNVKLDANSEIQSHKYRNNNHLVKIRKKRYKPRKILSKFIKNITMKKHTTRTNFDSLQMSEPSERDKFKINDQVHVIDDIIQRHDNFQRPVDEQIAKVAEYQAPVDDEIKTDSNKVKRNIKDVYYKAVHDAAKYTEKTSMHPRYTNQKT